MRARSYGYLIGSLLFVCGVVALFSFRSNILSLAGKSVASAHPDTQVALWESAIKTIGPQYAHTLFVWVISTQENTKKHKLAHLFGAALFEVEGMEGIGVCSTQFQYGCFHEYFKRFIATYGTSALPNAIKTCEGSLRRLHPCEHAVGHGLVAYYGYGEEALVQSLRECNKLFTDDLINGCVGGVFMEFNLYSSVSVSEDPRPVVRGEYYTPCTKLPQLFQESCVWWLPQWWVVLGEKEGENRKELFGVMGDRCRDLPTQLLKHRRMCFNSIGQKAASASGWNEERTVALCRSAARSESELLFCVSYAAYMFTYMHDTRQPDSGRLCAFLPSEEHRHVCGQYARMEKYVLSEAFVDVRGE